MNEEEQLLLVRLSKGDTTAYWEIWQRNHPYLRGLCLRWMRGDRVQADDALSCVILKACLELPEYATGIYNLKAWLGRLARNVCIDLQREQRTCLARTMNLETIPCDAQVEQSRAQSPEETLAMAELCETVRREILNLPPSLSEPCLLRFLQDLSYQEISKRLCISATNARKRVQLARIILRERLWDVIRK